MGLHELHGPHRSQGENPMKTEHHVTMDGEELALLEKYERTFGEVPLIAFLHPQTSKKLMRIALKSNRPVTVDDLKSNFDLSIRGKRAVKPKRIASRSVTVPRSGSRKTK
jgi:hypothetical protein